MADNSYMERKIGAEGVAPIKDPFNNSVTSNPFKGRGWSYNVGDKTGIPSRYDDSIGDISNINAEEVGFRRGEEQTLFNRLGNSVVNHAVIAGTTVVSGTLGLAYGIFDALANDEISRIWDNPINRKAAEIQEAANEYAPNYYTSDYNDKSVWKKMGTDIFWADLIKNLGYTTGMLIPGTAVSKALSTAPKIVQLIGSTAAGALSEASMEAINAKNEKENNELTVLADSYRRFYSEAATDRERQMLQEAFSNAYTNIKEDARQTGNYVMANNAAYLTLSNMIGWGKFFTRGNKASRAALIAKERAKGITVAEDGLSLNIEQPWLNTVKNVGTKVGQMIAEGSEEVAQDIFTRAADLTPDYNSFNESIYNPDKRELANSSIQAYGMALSQAMKDPETATLFAMGAITSAIGAPTLRSIKSDEGKYRIPFEFNGGIHEFLGERAEYNKKRNIVESINERMSGPEFQEYYNGLVRDMDLTEKANQALEDNDEFNFQNYQFASMVSDIIMFDNVGHTDVLENIVDKASNMSDEEIQGLLDSGLFQKNGNPMSIQEAKEKLGENASTMKELMTRYQDAKEALETSKKGPDFSKDALENLIYAKMQIDNWRKRQGQIVKEVTDLYHSFTPMMETEDIIHDSVLGLMTVVPETRNELKDIIKKSDLTIDDKENWIRKLEDLEKIQDNINKFTEKINSYYTSPEKANKSQEKIKERAIKKSVDRNNADIKSRLSQAQSPSELRKIYRTISDEGKTSPEELEKVVNELVEENNPVAVSNRDIQNFYQGTVNKLSEMGLSNSEITDSIQMLKKAVDKAGSLGALITPDNPHYTQIATFFTPDNPMGEDREAEVKRFYNTQVNVYKAIAEQFKDLNKVEDSARFTKSINTNPKPGYGIALTGNSVVSSAPAANPTNIVVHAESISEDGFEGVHAGGFSVNQDKDGITETPYTKGSQTDEIKEESTNIDRSWFPLSWFYLGAKRKEGKLISIGNTEAINAYDKNLDFRNLAQWLVDTHAQEYVDNGNIKVGDKLVLGVPANLKDNLGNPVIAYYKIQGEDRIPVGIFTSGNKEAYQIRDSILQKYNKADKTKDFFSDYVTTVNDVKDGYVSYMDRQVTVDNSSEPLIAVVKNNRITLGQSAIPASHVRRPKKISEKNGMIFIAVPGARKGMNNGYRLVGMKVKSFSHQDFPINETTVNNPYYKGIQQGISMIMSSKTQKELLEGVKALSDYLYMKGLNFYITDEGIRVTKLRYNSKGNPIQKNIKLSDGSIRTVFDENVVGVFKTAEALEKALYRLNLRFQMDDSQINKKEYNKKILDSGILLSNADIRQTYGGWFTVNQLNVKGEELDSSKIGFPQIPITQHISTPVSADNTLAVSIGGRQMVLFENGDYQSLATGQRKTPKTAEEAERNRVLYTLQKNYGNATEGATMWNNKAVVGDKVIDRNTGNWITGKEAQDIRDHVEGKVKSAGGISAASGNIYDNHDNMNPVNDISKDSNIPNGKTGYYFDDRDNRIHKTSMVPVGELFGTPVSLFKVPVKSKGINSSVEHVVGYNYGLVFPNGQSYISSQTNPDRPADNIFPMFKKALEKDSDAAKTLQELMDRPSVFSNTSAAQTETHKVNAETAVETQKFEDDEFGLDDMFDNDSLSSIDRDSPSVARLRGVDSNRSVWNREEELKWLNRVLPDIPVEIQEGILRISGKNAWGMFSNAGIILSNIAAEGTAYHEAFHAVFVLGLTNREQQALLDEVQKESGISDKVEAEEWLAERFMEFVANENTKSVRGKIKRLFRRLWNTIKSILNIGPYRYSIYRKILKGDFKNIKIEKNPIIEERLTKTGLSKETTDILKSTRDSKDLRNDGDTNDTQTTHELLESGYSEEFIRKASPELLKVMSICKGL